MDVNKLIKGYTNAKGDRVVWDSTWEDILYYSIPRKRDITVERTPGEKQPYDVYDATAIQANRTLAAGLSGYLTNASQRWFEIKARNSSLNKDSEVRAFFEQSADRMFDVFAQSNFYQQIHETYLDLGSVGTACLYEEEDPQDVVRFSARHIREYYIAEDSKKKVNTIYRLVQFTAAQAIDFFGEKNVSEEIQKCYTDGKIMQKFDYLHCVMERNVFDPSKSDAKNKRFASYWVDMRVKKIVREGGYDEFPFMVPRFYKASDEVYGYSPAHQSYPDIRTINELWRLTIEAAEHMIYPPFLMEHDSLVSTLDLRAGAINFQKQPMNQGPAVSQLTTGNRVDIAQGILEIVAEKIEKEFFVDLFLMISRTPNMTATEVMQRAQEKMLILGPVLGRLQNELLNPVITRTFNIMLRRGLLPAVPQQLANQEFDIVYVSPLAKAQRAALSRDTQEFLAVVGQMAQYKPEVLDKIDADAVVDYYADIKGVTRQIVLDAEEVGNLRQVRAKQQQAQQQLMMLQQGAAMYKDAAKGGVDEAKARAITETGTS